MMGVALLAMATGLLAQKKDKSDPNVRSVQGTVRGPDDAPIEGAVVQLKDTKSLQVRSFITRADGNYHFQGLNPNVDYELKAEYQGKSSDTKTLSVFDSRSKAVIHLKIPKK
jgi:hypothetical protein